MKKLIKLSLLLFTIHLSLIAISAQTEQKAELVVQTGHSARVNSIAYSPDGKIIASGSSDKTIKLWDAETVREICTLTGHTSLVSSVIFSPDGKILASGSGDKIIKLWDVASRQELRALSGHTSLVTSVVFSPDGKTLASGSLDKTVKLWDVASGQELRILNHQTSWVNSVAFSPDGKTLASSGSGDKTIKLWNAANGQEIRTLSGHTNSVYSVTFSPDGKTLASGSSDGSIKLWDVASGQELLTLKGQTSYVDLVAFSPDGKILSSGSGDRTVKLWDLSTGKELKTFTQNVAPLSISFSPDGRTIAYTSQSEFNLADVETGIIIRTSPSTPFEIKSVAISQDKNILAFSDNQGNFVFWDIQKNERITTNEIPDWAKVQKSVQSINEIDVQSNGSFVSLIDKKDKKEIARMYFIGNSDWSIIMPDGRFDISGNGGNSLYYIFDSEIVELETLKDMYYEPGLLQKILGFSKEPLRAVIALKDIKLYPEIIEQKYDEKTGKLTIKLKSRGGGIGKTSVFVNDKQLFEDVRDAKLKANPNLPLGEIVNLTVYLKGASIIKGKENRIKIVTSNYLKEIGKGNLQSRGTGIFFVDSGKEEFALPTLYAIVGGISDYDGDQLDLRFPAKDAEDFSNALSLGARRLFCPTANLNCSKVQITTLSTSGKEGTIQPTKENFKKAFAEIAKKAKPEDILVVYLAGHGVTLGTGTDTYFYLTKEARSTSREDLSKTFQTTAISSEELAIWLRDSKALKQVLILDTASAGSFSSELRLKAERDLSTDQIRAIEFLKDKTGIFVLMGSAADGASYEASQYGQGLLTYSLLQAMKGAALDINGFIDVGRLFGYAQESVRNLAANLGGIQRPIVSAPSGKTFVIGQMTEADKQKINLPKPKPVVLRPSFGNKEFFYDELNISNNLRKQLDSISSRPDSVFIYVDSDEFPDAIVPTGIYTVTDKQIEVNLFLLKNNKKIAEKTIIGSIEGIAELIVKAIENLLNELEISTNINSSQKNKVSNLSVSNSLPEVNSQVFQNQNPFSFEQKADFLPNAKVDFKPIRYNPNAEKQDGKIIMVRPLFLSDKKTVSAVNFEKGLINYLKLIYGEGKNKDIEFKDIDELQNAVRLEWRYEEDNVFSTVKFYLAKEGQKISIDKDIGTRKGDIEFLVISVTKWITGSHETIKIKSRGVEIVDFNNNLRQHIGKQYALLIATNDYDYLNDLKNPMLDVCTIAKILEERYGFETEIAINKTKTEINQLLRQYLIKSYEENSELLIFVAGHGSYDRLTNIGYLATKDSKAKDDFHESYISFKDLVGIIDKIPVKHIWLVLDTCNAGLITKETARNTEGKLSKEEFVKDRLRNKTRMALAATEGERYVSDGIPGKHSPFARDFIDILLTDGGADGNGILITSEFATVLFENGQKPRFGKLSDDDEPGSDFVLILLDEKERKNRQSDNKNNVNSVDSELKSCKCIFQKYGKEKYNPQEVCNK